MPPALSLFLQRHPLLRDSILWAVPALLFGALLRLCLLHYLPYAYWGSDSRSYFDFTYKLFAHHDFSLNEKRRFLYPIFICFVSLLPGAPLRWLPWIQHGLGLLTLLPLAYLLRKNLEHWRWLIVPVTVAYAGLPVILWFEHELLGETIFYALIIWAFAGWSAWVQETRLGRSVRLWWLFLVPYALFILTKPAGRFYWPGLLLGLLGVQAWRKLTWVQIGSIAAVMAVTPFVGSKAQAAWLLYTASFPLTRLETPAHADYKAEVRDMVEPLRRNIDTYYTHDEGPFEFLENPGRKPGRPLWAKLQTNTEARKQLYFSLAWEGIVAEPILFFYTGVQRVLASANFTDFRRDRFFASYTPDRFRDDYETAQRRQGTGEPTAVPMALGSSHRPLPAYEEFARKLSPAPDSWSARFINSWVAGWASLNLIAWPQKDVPISQLRPTLTGCWLLLSILLSALPAYRKTFGVWTLAALSYLLGVFIVSQSNSRYFAGAWPALFPAFAVLPDYVIGVCRRWRKNAGEPSPGRPAP